ncbi:MAG: GNAT family N-acetyltransferase [Candidatus Tectomicrobia bacterium]|uniref:GNAT family N-acetyltransferase n=1 Tax=Tectimicrobiota bacterium TaxID=2528274 RepID=A0A937W2G9_UNCTE|nr:GNAT family N-acetyltransferase [Candidatus Tectomicrobia bacterium]
MDIRIDDLRGPEIAALLQEHLRDMYRTSPPESVHALDLEGLRKPEITFWTIWDGDTLAGCGALKALDPQHAEIKSMRTAPTHRRQGVATQMLQHILQEAKRRGYTQVSLETGAMDFFLPARTLYASFGFAYCAPFADYVEDPNSVFMTKQL